MEWQDEGLILGLRRHGETSVIVEIMTRAHGRHMGLVRGGRSSKMRAMLQPGNSVTATWRARLDEHLGTFQLEAHQLRAAQLMESSIGIYGLQTLAGHLRLLAEREEHKNLYEASLIILDHMDNPDIAGPLMVRFELALLEELGFGLELTRCAATGSTVDLIWVSPKSGKAVSRDAGEPWADKLLALPQFLQKTNPIDQVKEAMDEKALINGQKLSAFFLDRHIYGPRGITAPSEREGFWRAIAKHM